LLFAGAGNEGNRTHPLNGLFSINEQLQQENEYMRSQLEYSGNSDPGDQAGPQNGKGSIIMGELASGFPPSLQTCYQQEFILEPTKDEHSRSSGPVDVSPRSSRA
jgi:hypothetical protein